MDQTNGIKDGPAFWASEHEGRLVAMIEVAQAAGKHTLTYFRRADLVVDCKADESPVTVADREAEQLVRREIRTRFPNDTIQGEEFSEQPGTSAYRWVVDPIDGTKSFVCGVPLYSTLLALEFEGEPLAGIIFHPSNERNDCCLSRQRQVGIVNRIKMIGKELWFLTNQSSVKPYL